MLLKENLVERLSKTGIRKELEIALLGDSFKARGLNNKNKEEKIKFYRRILGLRRIKNLIKFIDGEIPALFIEDERLKKILAFNGVDLQVFISGKKETKKTIISVSITTTILKEFDKVVDKKKSNRSMVIEKLMKYYISKYCKN